MILATVTKDGRKSQIANKLLQLAKANDILSYPSFSSKPNRVSAVEMLPIGGNKGRKSYTLAQKKLEEGRPNQPT
jgi:hypothetical protein